MISVSQEIKNKIAEDYLSKDGVAIFDPYEAVDFRLKKVGETYAGPIGVNPLEDKVLILRKKRWVPKVNCEYFYVAENFSIRRDLHYDAPEDNGRIAVGNCFSAFHLASAAAGRMKDALVGGTN